MQLLERGSYPGYYHDSAFLAVPSYRDLIVQENARYVSPWSVKQRPSVTQVIIVILLVCGYLAVNFQI